jgi:hypothetical protein
VLLNLYGYSKKTRDELVTIFEENAARVRLPYQFGLEYARNRSTVIVKQVNNCFKVEESLRKVQREIEAKHDHPFLTKKSTRAYKAILKELEDSRHAMERLVGHDPYAEKLFSIFEGRVGKCPSTEELVKLEDEAQQRFSKLTPPGFADVKEKAAAAAGDYIGWAQLMDISKSEGKGMILVTDDFKEDWWLVERERNLGPRPELLEEFFQVTKQPFFMYSSESFLRYAKEFMASQIRDEVIEEVSLRLASQRESEQADALKPVSVDKPPSEVPKATAPSEEKATESKPQSIPDSEPGAKKVAQETEVKREASNGG